MRILYGALTLALAASVACAGRTTATTTTAAGTNGATASTTATAAATANAGGGQAAERLTVADLENRMKEINQHNQAMRKQLMGGMTADAAKEATELVTLFGDVERFWAQRNRNDAVKWSQDARTFATEAAGAATANDAMKATQAANNMLASCKMCHGTYREMDPAGGFRIKAELNIQ
jgi:hypothetical protein